MNKNTKYMKHNWTNKSNSKYTNEYKLRRIRGESLPGFNKIFDLIEKKEITLNELGIRCKCIQFPDKKCDHYYQLRRFPWRFRMAQHCISFNTDNDNLKFDKETGNCYEQLGQFFMIWTAFEEYIRMFGVFPSQFSLFIPDAQISNLCRKLRSMDQDNKLVDFLIKHSKNSSGKKRLKSFKNGNNRWIIIYCQELRNMFAHGTLTANPNNLEAKEFSKFLTVLNKFFIKQIREHFSELSIKY
tara:strand:- start:74 stop:799 length:726 start_codon:yes stop_codon:yes gene_type:complete